MSDSVAKAAIAYVNERTRAASRITALVEKRKRLTIDMEAVEAEITEILGPIRTKRRKQRKQASTAMPRNGKLSLACRLAFILASGKNEPTGVHALIAAAKKGGWKTNSVSPANVVGQILTTDPDFVSPKKAGAGWTLTKRAYKEFSKAKLEDYA